MSATECISNVYVCVRACESHLVSTNTKRESGVDADVKAPEKKRRESEGWGDLCPCKIL